MIIQDTDSPYRDENEGSVILSLISQLRYVVYVTCKVRSRSDTRLPKGWDGFVQSDFPYICTRAPEYARAYYGFHVTPRSHIRVSILFNPSSNAPYNPLPSAEKCDDPEERFIRILQYYLAGWHIKPKGVKKP